MIPDEILPIRRLIAIMARLRDPQLGCEWDRAQDFSTIAPYTIEEAYEVADAIQRHDMADLKDELGDLLLQVVFHARMAEEAGLFDFADVATSISTKLETRHPHIFADGTQDSRPQTDRWEDLKAAERLARGTGGALDGIALALPALLRAEKLQRRAARQGFDWPDIQGPTEKIQEELEELVAAATPEERVEEAGDLLFAVVNLVRKNGVSAEEALRAANSKFERRFKAMEDHAAKQGEPFAERSLNDQEALWQAVKSAERA